MHSRAALASMGSKGDASDGRAVKRRPSVFAKAKQLLQTTALLRIRHVTNTQRTLSYVLSVFTTSEHTSAY
eukprot:10654-Heterococcus_DN1.PRE.2